MKIFTEQLVSAVSVIALGTALCAVALPAAAQSSAPDNKAALAGVKEMKMAFDITDANPEALLLKLAVIDLTRKQLIADGVTPRIVLAFRGDASYFTQTDLEKIKPADREGAIKVAAKIREMRSTNGYESMEQCSVPLPARKIRNDDVMPEVKLVGNGWISLVAYQHRGYAYITP
ncbi:MAG TPA: DsrE family protein [Quisquiliibacterium sp.]|nr:DsrE family protein [Quisquiliibacterium sp.]